MKYMYMSNSFKFNCFQGFLKVFGEMRKYFNVAKTEIKIFQEATCFDLPLLILSHLKKVNLSICNLHFRHLSYAHVSLTTVTIF